MLGTSTNTDAGVNFLVERNGYASMEIFANQNSSARDAVLRLHTRNGGAQCRIYMLDGDGAGDVGGQIEYNHDGDKMILHTANAARLELTNDGRAKSQFTVAAWAQYKGTDTNVVRDSHNISSVTDNGNGDYTFNFANNMINEYYSVTGTAEEDGSTGYKTVYLDRGAAPAVGAVRLQSINQASSYMDTTTMCMQVTGGTM